MRHVKRTVKPKSLQKNAHHWKSELLDAIAAHDEKRIGRIKHRYNKPDVRNALNKMYRNYCCYCESEVGSVRADQIEHRKPVNLFPEHTFDWNNLHLACSACNRNKSDKWDSKNPVLDAVKDHKIPSHLGYESSDSGVRRLWHTKRGETTVDHTELNRERLRILRGMVLLEFMRSVQKIRTIRKRNAEDAEVENLIARLREKTTGQFGSMIEWALDTFID